MSAALSGRQVEWLVGHSGPGQPAGHEPLVTRAGELDQRAILGRIRDGPLSVHRRRPSPHGRNRQTGGGGGRHNNRSPA